MKLITVIITLSLCAYGQMLQGIVGDTHQASGPPPTTVTFNGYCTGNGSTASLCSWSSTPTAGNAVVIVIWTSTSATITSVCDGTGGDFCTGSSTYALATGSGYANASNFKSWVYYTCNFAGSTTGIAVTFTGGGNSYLAATIAAGNSTSSCVDGYAHNQDTSATTAYTTSPNAVTTTNAHDLLIGFATNGCGGGSYTAGTDGQGNTFTNLHDNTVVALTESFAESATAGYIASATGPSCQWNMEVIAIK